MSGPATIDDVAREAGVRTATVSRAMRDHPYVAETTRARVKEAAARLRYVANPNAARLASGATSTVALLAPVLTSWYTAEVVAGVEEVLAEAGYDLLIATADPQTRDPRPDAGGRSPVPPTGGRRAPRRRDGARSGSRLARVARCAGGRARRGTAHRHVRVRRQRRRGGDGGFTIDGGLGSMRALLTLRQPPTAVFAMSDEMAFGVLQALRESGLVGRPRRVRGRFRRRHRCRIYRPHDGASAGPLDRSPRSKGWVRRPIIRCRSRPGAGEHRPAELTAQPTNVQGLLRPLRTPPRCSTSRGGAARARAAADVAAPPPRSAARSWPTARAHPRTGRSARDRGQCPRRRCGT